MTMRYRREQLSHDLGSLILTESLFLQDGLKELSSRAVLLDDIEVFIILEKLV